MVFVGFFFFSSRRRHTSFSRDWSSDVCSSDLPGARAGRHPGGSHMRDAVIVEAVRTPVGKRKGGLSGVHAGDLSSHVLTALAERSGIDPALVEDVIWGCVSQVGEQTLDIARTALLGAGWPETVPGTTVDRQCGSSQQAISFAAASVIAGHYDVAVAGGVESMSRVPMGASIAGGAHGNPFSEGFQARYNGVFPNQ